MLRWQPTTAYERGFTHVSVRLSGSLPGRNVSNPRDAARRSTSNRNVRGSAQDRRRRKLWLLSPEAGHGGDGEKVACAFACGTILTFETLWVDRIVPGAYGGTYVRSNIQPACEPCQLDEGGRLGQVRRGLVPDA